MSTQETQTSTALEMSIGFQIADSTEITQEPYLGRADCEPSLQVHEDGSYTLYVRNQGKHREFTVPYISTVAIWVHERLIACVIAYHGTESEKFGKMGYMVTSKGQFWRYYIQTDDGIWQRVEWPQLDDESRQAILDAGKPEWAKVPGKLRSQRAAPTKRPRTRLTTYKIVRVINDRFYSVFQRDEEYIIGEKKTETARQRHRGGYYSYPNLRMIMKLFRRGKLFNVKCYKSLSQVALLECEISGKMIVYDNGKIASSHITPLRVIKIFTYGG